MPRVVVNCSECRKQAGPSGLSSVGASCYLLSREAQSAHPCSMHHSAYASAAAVTGKPRGDMHRRAEPRSLLCKPIANPHVLRVFSCRQHTSSCRDSACCGTLKPILLATESRHMSPLEQLATITIDAEVVFAPNMATAFVTCNNSIPVKPVELIVRPANPA